MKNTFRHHILIIIACLVSITCYAGQVKLSISSSMGSAIHVGDKFIITVRTENVNGSPSSFQVPGATSDQFSSSSSSNISVSIGSGGAETHSSSEYKMLCRATTPGTYTLGPIIVGGVKSNVIKYTIHGGSNSQSSSPQQTVPSSSGNDPKFIGTGNGNLFMRASVSKATAYEQEALVYTVKLYCSFSRIKFIGATASPKFDGFVVEESKQTDNQMHVETLDGKRYATAVIARYIIFPQMTGSLKITGNTYTVSVDESEYYHDPYFGGMTVSRPIQLNVTPNDLQINVKALPEPKPADFSGGVGHFSISSMMPVTHLKTGEAASITYTVNGSGNLKYVTLPELNNIFPKQLEVYSPQTDIQSNVTSTSVAGKVRFDYTIMPDEEGEYSIPDITLVYFNPETGSYEKSVAKGYKVVVGKGSNSNNVSKSRTASFDSNLIPVDKLDPDARPYIDSFSYWLWYIISTLLLGIVMIVYRKHLKEMADVASMLSKKASKMARKRLRKAATCLSKNDYSHFYDEMLSALWGYVSFKMKMPTSELTRENISDVMIKAGIPQNQISKFIDLLDSCEYAKYSPDTERSQSMQMVYDKGVEIINELEESFKKADKK